MIQIPGGSAGRLVHLLKLVATGPSTFALGELVERSGLPPSSVHRLLKEMVSSGLVERGAGQAYKPGRELFRLASQLVSRFDLARSARPFLESLVEDWKETAVLCVYSPTSHNAVIADVVPTPHPLRFAVEIGGVIALPWGSLGRAILAFLPPGEIEAVIREATVGPISGQPRSPRGVLETELSSIREHGFSQFFDSSNDIAGIASPVFGAGREILGCLGVTMPSKRYQLHTQDDLAIAVRSAAQDLTDHARIAYS